MAITPRLGGADTAALPGLAKWVRVLAIPNVVRSCRAAPRTVPRPLAQHEGTAYTRLVRCSPSPAPPPPSSPVQCRRRRPVAPRPVCALVLHAVSAASHTTRLAHHECLELVVAALVRLTVCMQGGEREGGSEQWREGGGGGERER